MRNLPPNVYWYSLQDPNVTASLSGEIKTKVVVIGGGIAGLSCAQSLNDAGVQVVILERDFCGSGASGKTSGFITPDSEIELSSLVDNYGNKKAKQIWEFVVSGVDRIRKNIEKYNISCDYQKQDSLFIANSSSGFAHVTKEHESRVGLEYVSNIYDKNEIKNIIGSVGYHGGVRYPETFGMNSYLYCQGIKDQLLSSGVLIYEKTNVKSISGNAVQTDNGVVTADKILVCTDRFIPDLGTLKDEIYHVQTFLGISKPLSSEQVKKIFPTEKMMVWDTDLVYNYFRITGDNRMLIGGGDLLYTYAQNTESKTSRFERRLKNYMQKKFPEIDFEMEYLWPGMLGVSKDLLPIVGTDKVNTSIFYVGAATGLPWAAALGHYAAEHFLNGRSEFDEIFSPDRKFIIGHRLQYLLGKPVTYAVSHGIAKYL